MLVALLKAARPKQWVKNAFVAAPLVFAKHLTDYERFVRAGAAVAIFCLLSSAVYLMNDLHDVEKDRAHPVKKNRPIASGKLSPNAARVAAGLFAAGSLSLGLLLGWPFALTATGYLTLNVAYTFFLKRVVVLDVLAIAGGFLLRVLGGAFAIHVWTSPYLLVCTALLASFLGFGKRAHELSAAGDRAGEQRAVLRAYNPKMLKAALFITSVATLAAYVLYTRAEHTIAFFETTKMVATTPFAAFGLWRFMRLVLRSDSDDSPTDAMLRDWPFMLNLVVWGVTVCLIIYYEP
jgi:4-hydroxybenzoate polyprenyltransferase